MKIIRTAEEIQRDKREREQANKDCYKCPCCGNDKVLPDGGNFILHPDSIKRIVISMEHLRIPEFRTKYPYKDLWTCGVCGAKWESNIYWQKYIIYSK